MTEELYQRITDITEEYLGPAAERFVTRQITFHLGKTPQELEKSDIPKFVEWTKVTLSLITEDRRMVEEYTLKIARLVER